MVLYGLIGSCLVLSGTVLSWWSSAVLYGFVLSCFILSGTVLGLIASWLVMSGPLGKCMVSCYSMGFYDNVFSCAVLYCSAFSRTVRSTMVLFSPRWSCTDPVRPSMVMYCLVWLYMVQYCPVGSCVELYVLAWSYIALYCIVWFYMVLYILIWICLTYAAMHDTCLLSYFWKLRF